MGLITNTLYNVDSNTIVLALVFIILLVLINFSLSKIFKKDKTSATIISLCVSLLAVYGIERMNWDLSGIIFTLGISEEILYAIVPWIILGIIIWISFAKDKRSGRIKFRFFMPFLILGTMLVALSFTPLIYQKSIVLITGIVFLIIGIISWFKKMGRDKDKEKGVLKVRSIR
ncbi:MAG: hypothetical protein ABIE36_00475 [Candidatus Diapherotrites archaeon]